MSKRKVRERRFYEWALNSYETEYEIEYVADRRSTE